MQDRSLDPHPTQDYVPTPAETVDPVTVSQISATTQSPNSTPAIPLIPGYTISSEIAQGGMGRVYAGIELKLDREVAIKTLLPGAKAERFVVEAKITARLRHPSIPPVYALGTLADGAPYLAMKLVRGKTLADELKHRQNSLDDLSRFMQIFEKICQAVGFAHSQGIIHRDLKPANIIVDAFGEVQVMDWGLARDLRTMDNLTYQESDGETKSDSIIHLTVDAEFTRV